MSETTSSTPEKTVVVNNNHFCRLWTLTIISLALNGIILVLLVVGFIFHHHCHHKHHGFDGGRGSEGHFGRADRGEFGHGHRFHHFGGRFGSDSDQGRGKHGGFGKHGMRGDNDSDNSGMMGGGAGMRHGGSRGSDGGMMGGGMMGGNHEQNTPPDPAKMTDKMIDRLSAKLTLTDDEKAKIKPIIAAQVDQMQKDRETQLQAHQKAMEDTKAKIKALLTPDQQKLLDAMPQPGQKPAAAQAKPPGQ